MEVKALKFGGLTAKRPIVQGGMGVGVSLSSLAGNVAKCGGVGTISGVHPGYREADFKENPFRANLRAIGNELEKAKEIANGGIIGFNFMTVMNHYEEYVKEAIAAGADFIVSGAGLPVNLAKYAAGTRAAILPIVSSARALKLIVKQWQRADRLPDAVVVEGPLAGGHLGYPYGHLVDGTFDTLEDSLVDVVDYVRELEEKNGVKIPVVAGGGVRNHADMERLMALGASGVQVGTKFVATEECDAAPAFKQAYLRSHAISLALPLMFINIIIVQETAHKIINVVIIIITLPLREFICILNLILLETRFIYLSKPNFSIFSCIFNVRALNTLSYPI